MKLPKRSANVSRKFAEIRYGPMASLPMKRGVKPSSCGGGGGSSPPRNACQEKYGDLVSQCPDGTCCPFGYYCVYNPTYSGYYCTSGGQVNPQVIHF